MSRLQEIGLLEATLHGGRLFGHVGSVDLFVVPQVDGSFSVHHGPEIDPVLDRLARDGGARIIAMIRAGFGSAEASTGDPGLDRLVTEGGGRIISLAPRAPLPPVIGWLRSHRGRRCGPFLAGAISAVQVLAFREPDGAWIVYRKETAHEPACPQEATPPIDAAGSSALAAAIRRGATVAMCGAVISGKPSAPDASGMTAEAMSAELPGALVAEVLTAGGRKARRSPEKATP